jgi:hypothetical protein
MSNPLSPRNPTFLREWMRRLDRAAADLNVLLVVFAIGLAALDVTFLFSQQLIDRLPQVTRVVDVERPAASPSQSNSAIPR